MGDKLQFGELTCEPQASQIKSLAAWRGGKK